MALTTPFDYRTILIGEEIIYRALIQQEDFHQKGWYGAQWDDRDQIEKKRRLLSRKCAADRFFDTRRISALRSLSTLPLGKKQITR